MDMEILPKADVSSVSTKSAKMSMIVDTGSGLLLEKDARIAYPEPCGVTSILRGKSNFVKDEVQGGIECRSRESKKAGLCGVAVPRQSNICKKVMHREHNASSEDGHCSFRIEYGDGVQSGHIRQVRRLGIKGMTKENDLEALRVMIGLSTRSMSCSFRHNIAGMDFSKISLLTQLYDKGLIDAYKMGIYDSTASGSLLHYSSSKKADKGKNYTRYMILGSFEPEWTQDASRSDLMTFPIYRGKEMRDMGSHMDSDFMTSVDNMDRDVLDRHIYTVIDTVVVGKRRYGKQVETTQQGNGQARHRFSAIIDTGSTAIRIPKDMYAAYIKELIPWAQLYGFRVVDEGNLCLVHENSHISEVMMDAKAAQSFPLISIVLQGNSKSVDISLLEMGDVLMEANQVCLKLEVSKPNNEQFVLGTPFFSNRYVSLDLGKRLGTVTTEI